MSTAVPPFGMGYVVGVLAETGMGTFEHIRPVIRWEADGRFTVTGWSVAASGGYVDLDADGRCVRTGAWLPVELLRG